MFVIYYFPDCKPKLQEHSSNYNHASDVVAVALLLKLEVASEYYQALGLLNLMCTSIVGSIMNV